MHKVLFLAANPRETSPLQLGQEVRTIDERLQLAKLRDRFILEQAWALRSSDLQYQLLRHEPQVVHFSGHGTQTGEIVLEDESGEAHPVSPDALGGLFKAFRHNVRCVVLNSCYSERQAQGLSESVDFVVGMSRAIGDESAVAFAGSFYQALGFGRSIQEAFDLGCNQISLRNLGQQDIPKLKVAAGADPSQTLS